MWLPLRWLQPQRMVSQMFADRESYVVDLTENCKVCILHVRWDI